MNATEEIRLERRFAHSTAALWSALTDPTLLAKWWAAGDVRPIAGHRFALDMGPWGKQPCEVLAVEPERLFAFRFAVGTLDTTITWRLAPDGDGTSLTLTHSGFDVSAPMGRGAYEGMRAGWPGVLSRLDATLAG